ncbi:long-chain fatty acid--CoA ligase [Candidatus Endobugula sertula]|uniref:Long-chain-fatty-acid--CoA ligase n=1 Tax=Candidatus Endobugula sertula TaxID=62101 RepID=A0A1D2QNY4_9GAMM|nr:long-chain fatty acid--CoA ligase [Candidatus Endobugula sertula]
MRVGVVLVNTNPLYTGKELQHQLNDSGAKVLVVLANVAKAAESVIDETDIQHVIITEVGDLHCFPKRQLINGAIKYIKKQVFTCHFPSEIKFLQALKLGERDHLAPVEQKLSDIAFLQYTGGTTGIAKGAMLTHGNLLTNKSQLCNHWTHVLEPAKEVFLAPLPLYHIYGFTMHCMVLIANGGHSVLVPNPRDLKSLIKTFKSYPLTGMVGLNTLFVALLNNPDFRQLDFSGFKLTISGGMALVKDTANRWRELTGTFPVEGYGLTETSPVVTVNLPESCQLGTIGQPLPETECKVVDAEGQNLGREEVGELCIRGPQVMLGYWNRPEDTAEVLDSDGWFHSGDIAVIQDDGYIRIVDRKKDMIIVSGFNVYPNEVEDVLVGHPDIIEAAVVAVPDDCSGEAVKAFIVLTETSGLDDESIKAFCKQSLVAYKVPRFYEFRDELPKTNVGKVLRRELSAHQLIYVCHKQQYSIGAFWRWCPSSLPGRSIIGSERVIISSE